MKQALFERQGWPKPGQQETKMIITNDTTTWQVAELMGDEADEMDGRIMLGLISRECESDTDAIHANRWTELLEEAAKIRDSEGVAE